MQPRVKESMSFWHWLPRNKLFSDRRCNESGEIIDAVWIAFESQDTYKNPGGVKTPPNIR
jgi:hypothetical protein